MDDFIAKPIDPNAFVSVITSLLPLGPQQPATTEPATPSTIVDVDEDQLDGLARLLPRMKFCAVVESYLTTAKSRLERIQALAAECDYLNLGNEAHDLKSTSGSFGARRLQTLAKQLEDACLHRDAEQVAQLTAAIAEASTIAWPLIRRRLRRDT
jgi:HPt (histidine-containing phosphotransfer) domain-containing protein